MNDIDFITKMDIIVSALKERGYDPYVQLLGYITENQLYYITSNKDARNLIQTLDTEQIKQYVAQMRK